MKRNYGYRKNTHLTEHHEKAAKLLIQIFKRPEECLLWFNDAMYWIHGNDLDLGIKDQNDSTIFFIKQIIEEVLVLWFENLDNPIKEMATGIAYIQEWCGAEGWYSDVAMTLSAYGKQAHDGGLEFQQSLHKHLQIFKVLFDIYYLMEESKEEINKQKKVA